MLLKSGFGYLPLNTTIRNLPVSPEAVPSLVVAALAAGYQPQKDERGRVGAIARVRLNGKRYSALLVEKEASYQV